MVRVARGLIPLALVAALACAARAQPGPQPDDEQRLQRERAERMQDILRQQGAGGVFSMVLGADGAGNIMRLGGPGGAVEVPELLILVDADVQLVFVVRGHTLYRFVTGADGALEADTEVDLRTAEEVERAGDAGDAFIWPDPAMVPVTAEWSALTGSLMVLRGGVLMQFSPALEALAEFDLRTEREKQGPRIRMQMRPGPPRDDGPPPAPEAEAPGDDG